jgi:hypothetical protein
MLICLVLLTDPCFSKNGGFLHAGPEYPPWDGPVRVYFYNPSGEYEEVGIVSTQGSTKEPLSYLITDLQRRAASMGANGIFVQSPTTTGTASNGTGVIKLTATAIRIE